MIAFHASPAPRARLRAASRLATGLRARAALSSQRSPMAETTGPTGCRARIARAITCVFSSLVQKRCDAELQGRMSLTHDSVR